MNHHGLRIFRVTWMLMGCMAFLAGSVCTVQASDGIFENPNFENGDVNGWVNVAEPENYSLSADPAAAHSGFYGMFVDGVQGSSGFDGSFGTFVTGVTPGHRYMLSFWLRTSTTGSDSRLRIWDTQWWDAADMLVGEELDDETYETGTEWHEVTRNADGLNAWWTAPPNAAKLRLIFRLYHVTGEYYHLDDFQLIDLDGGDTPTPTETPESTFTAIPSYTPTETPTQPTETPSPTQPTATQTPVPPTATETATPAPPTETPTAGLPTSTPTETATPVPATETPTSAPTDTPTVVPPTLTPTAVPPTVTPTDSPTPVPPTETPTAEPPTVTPTDTPTAEPPTETPTAEPTDTPTVVPPTETPTPLPTVNAWHLPFSEEACDYDAFMRNAPMPVNPADPVCIYAGVFPVTGAESMTLHYRVAEGVWLDHDLVFTCADGANDYWWTECDVPANAWYPGAAYGETVEYYIEVVMTGFSTTYLFSESSPDRTDDELTAQSDPYTFTYPDAPTPTETPVNTWTPTVTPTNTATPTEIPTIPPTPSNTPVPTFTPTPVPFTPTPYPTRTPTPPPTPTMTPEPTLTPPPTPTFTPPPPPTPTATAPSPPTPTVPPEPTATGTPYDPIVTIDMPGEYFGEGDTCHVHASVDVYEEITGYPLFVVLDVYGQYFFAPSWAEYDNYLDLYPVFNRGMTDIMVVPEFVFPGDVGSANDLVFIAALTDPEITQLASNVAMWEFAYGP